MFENPLAVFVLIDLTIIKYFQLLIIEILLDTLNQVQGVYVTIQGCFFTFVWVFGLLLEGCNEPSRY